MAWAARVGCTMADNKSADSDRLACLRNASVAALVSAGMPRRSQHDGFLYPTVDGTPTGFPADNRVLFRTGRFNRVPVLFGSADDDLGGSFQGSGPSIWDEDL